MIRFSQAKLSFVLISLLMGLFWFISGCGGQQPAPASLVVTPSIGEPKVGAPSPQQPGEEIGISIEIASTGGATLSYTWTADGGEIVRGQGSPAITYQVPKDPGTYNIRVKVEWDGQSVEKVTSVKVEALSTATPTPQTPIDNPTPKPQTNTPTRQPTNTPTAEPTNSPSPTPQPTTILATNTPVPELPTATLAIGFRDEFDNTLANSWNWVREDSTHWSLTDIPGFLRIVIQPGNIGYGEPVPNNLLLREAPAGNFEIATLVNFTPTSNYQFAGLLIYQDDENAIQLGRAFCNATDVCVGNGIYFDRIQNEVDLDANYPTTTLSQSQAYLRLRREGATYTGYYSEDGVNWAVIGQHTRNFESFRIGLIAAQANESETTADFDYFTVEILP